MALTGLLVVGAGLDDDLSMHHVDEALRPLLDRRGWSADPQETP